MAAGTAVRAYHSTIAAANTAETVVLTGRSPRTQIINRGNTDMYVRWDGTAAVGLAAETYVVRAGTVLEVGGGDATSISLVCSSISNAYTVQGLF